MSGVSDPIAGVPSLSGELPRHRIWIASRLAGLDLRRRLGARLRLVQDHAVEHAELANPRLPLERAVGFGIAGLPAERMPSGEKSMSLVWLSLATRGASSRTTCMRVSQ